MAQDNNYCIMRTEKKKTTGSIVAMIQHELRTRQTDNANEEEIEENIYSTEEGKKYKAEYIKNFENRKKIENEILAKYRKLLPKKLRPDNVTCIQMLITVSPEVAQKKNFNFNQYFKSAETWARKKFGTENIFFVSTHYDETTPHMMIHFVPGYNFRYKDGHTERRLSAKKWLGGKKKLSELQDEFFEEVGKKFSLDRGVKKSKAKHEEIQKWYAKFNEFCNKLNIEPQKKNESIDDYFLRVAEQWNTSQKKWSEISAKVKAEFQPIIDGIREHNSKLMQENLKLKTENEKLKKTIDNEPKKVGDLPGLKQEVKRLQKIVDNWRGKTADELREIANQKDNSKGKSRT